MTARDRLLDAAVVCLRRQGIRRTTVAAVADEAGLSRAYLYRLFPDKPTLLAAALIRRDETFWAEADERVAAAAGLAAKVAVAVDIARRSPLGPLAMELKESEPEAFAAVMGTFAHDIVPGMSGFWRRHLERAGDAGELRSGLDLDAAAEWVLRVVISLVGVPGQAVDVDDPDSVRAHLETFLLPALAPALTLYDPCTNPAPTLHRPIPGGLMDPSAFPTLDPELAPILELLPDMSGALDDIPAAREWLAALSPTVVPEGIEELEVTDVPLPSGAFVRTYRPLAATAPTAGLLHLHGGGFVLGDVEMEHVVCARIAREMQCTVASVEYRLAPEHPYPAGLEDCYAGLQLLAGLDGVDPDRLVVTGQSAGGGLAAATALLARDRGGPALCFQVLGIPELDDRLETDSMRAFTDTPMWSRPQAEASWRHYLGGQPADQYAAPARAESLAGLPPAYVVVCELDPLRDEGLAYAQRLLAAGISVELHCFPGAFHGAALVRGAAVVERMEAEMDRVLRAVLARPTT